MKPLVAWSLVCLPGLAAELSAQTWADLSPVAPSARSSHALVYDAARSRTVLFGGSTALGPAGDTWEFDGAAWAQVVPTGAPTARSGHAMVFDSARGRTVLFGGQTTANNLQADTWEYDGTTWSQVLTTTTPMPRTRHAMAYDAARGKTVLVGGLVLTSGAVAMFPIGETWEYDGTNWALITTSGWQAVSDQALAYDSLRQRIVMFGGLAAPGAIPANLSRSTQEYNGTSWVTVTTASSPSARMGHSLVFDPTSARTVLFAGYRGGLPLADAWQYDGTNWTNITGTITPTHRRWHSATFDVANSRMLVFGGLGHLTIAAGLDFQLGDTWCLTGITWESLVAPSVRSLGQTLAYDARHQRTVLFGGATGQLTANQYPNDTWELDGTRWTQVHTAVSPPARVYHQLVFHKKLQKLIMFGGMSTPWTQAPQAAFADTWDYDGSNWSQVLVEYSPPGRTMHALAYDEARARVVLFGGCTVWMPGGPTIFSDTWELKDEKTWQQVATPTSPPPTSMHALAYDAARLRTVLFGGIIGSGLSSAVSAETWEYDGVGWTHISIPAPPAPRYSHSLAFDAARGRTVLFGGTPGLFIAMSDQWEYDGSAWTQIAPALTPAGRTGHAATYDIRRGSVVMFGGADSNELLLDDTWAFTPAGTPTWTRHGVGCRGSAGIPSLDAAPGTQPSWGGTFALQLTGLPAQPGAAILMFGGGHSSYWNGSPLPVRLDAFGLLNCQLWIAPMAGASTLITHSGGSATCTLSIPATPATVGLVLSVQALVFDPAAQTRLATLTNAGIMTIF